jgi:flagellar protein FlaJ
MVKVEKLKEDKSPAPFVIAPFRAEKSKTSKELASSHFISYIASLYPQLKKDLKIAQIEKDPQAYIQESLIYSFFMSFFITLGLLLIFVSLHLDILSVVLLGIISFILVYLLAFNTFIYRPKVLIRKRAKEIDTELVFCLRHLLIELRAGVVLFDAMVGVSRDYGEVSKEFNSIVEKISLGVPTSAAIYEVGQSTPSNYLKRVLLQIANAMTSGSDIADSLEAVLNQISQEQIIKIKEYGQKLNPLSMFYMVFGMIIPSIGITLGVIVLSLLGSSMQINGPNILISIMLVVIVIQFIFVSIVDRSRPAFYL